MHAFLNESLRLTKELTGSEDDRGRAVTNLVVLGLGDIDESLRSRVHNIEQADESSSIVGDGHASSVMDEFVHTAGTCHKSSVIRVSKFEFDSSIIAPKIEKVPKSISSVFAL